MPPVIPPDLAPVFTVDWIHAALSLVVITDLALLGAEHHRLCIRLIALQGLIMGLLPVMAGHGEVTLYLIGMSFIFVCIKALILPWLLRRTDRQLPPHAPYQPYVGYSACVLLGVVGLILSLWLGARLGIAANPLFSLLFPIGLTTIISGILLIVTRRETLSQMFGYLVLENGIFLMGVPMAQEDALWLELSILLDILVAAFVMGIAIHHINRAFNSTDVDDIASLRD